MFQIVVDSGANIPAVYVKKYDIRVISFINIVNGKEIVCYTPDLTPEEERARGKEFYEAVRAGAQVKTSLVNSDAFAELFASILDAGEDILYISLSKNISGTYNAARIAADEVLEDHPKGHIRLVDAMNASLGQGLLAIYGSEMRAEGKSLDEVADALEAMWPHMNGMFTVEDLTYLSRTGRLSGAAALVGNLVQIKPILRGNADGFIVQFSKCRGRKKALKELIDLVCNNITEPEKQILGIAHADAYEESLYVVDEIKKRVPLRDVINTSYDFCTGAHVGPGTIALFFLAKDRELGRQL